MFWGSIIQIFFWEGSQTLVQLWSIPYPPSPPESSYQVKKPPKGAKNLVTPLVRTEYEMPHRKIEQRFNWKPYKAGSVKRESIVNKN